VPSHILPNQGMGGYRQIEYDVYRAIGEKIQKIQRVIV
jgi:hypothetical protein